MKKSKQTSTLNRGTGKFSLILRVVKLAFQLRCASCLFLCDTIQRSHQHSLRRLNLLRNSIEIHFACSSTENLVWKPAWIVTTLLLPWTVFIL